MIRAEPPAQSAETDATVRGARKTFASLRHRNFRLLWLGTMISHSGDWMDQIALNWLVYDLTGSALALGIMNAVRMIPVLLFTLVGGVMADRWPRRLLLMSTQGAAMLLALMLAVLVSTGVVEFWMILVIAFGRGVMMSFNQPARQSLISDVVPREDLMNAIALNAATNNSTRVIGPAIGGILIAAIGLAGAFYINALSFLAVLGGLALMQFPSQTKRVRTSVLEDLKSGMQYVMGHPNIRGLVILALVPMVFGMPYMSMLTIFARDVLQVGSEGLGFLTACSGVGAVAGALWVASLGLQRGRRRLMLMALVGFGATLVVFALSPWLWLSAVASIAVGMCRQLYNALNNTLIQESVDEEFRGRVVSTLFLDRAAVPLGTMLAGAGTAAIGAPVTTALMASILIVLAITARFFMPRGSATAVGRVS
jgi:MFS transporter, DHA1 family, staphyloferrin A biosynthesis exporter